MKLYESDNSHSINNIRQDGSIDQPFLNWQSNGVDYFLIVFAEKEEEVTFFPDSGSVLMRELFGKEKELISSREIDHFSITNAYAVLITIQDFILHHFIPKRRPGILAVYGCNLENGELVIYLPNGRNTYKFNVAVESEIRAEHKEKRIKLKKQKVYSGYYSVRLKRTGMTIAPGTVYYTVEKDFGDMNNIRYPIPLKLITDGGVFFVHCPENATITLHSTSAYISVR